MPFLIVQRHAACFAHMGYCDFFDVLAALSGLEMVLKEMGHPVTLGSALTAAQKSYAGQVELW